MTDAKILEVLERYERTAYDPAISRSAWAATDMQHIRKMIPQMLEFLADGRREKLMRWLGFIQGTFHAHRVYSLEELKDHVRP